jgi:hypothetical protein
MYFKNAKINKVEEIAANTAPAREGYLLAALGFQPLAFVFV